MTDKEDKTVRQFVLFCRIALMYEKKNYYNEQKHRAERETHIEMLSPKQSGMLEKIFDTYHADYFSVMGDTPYVLETVCLVIDERYKSGKPFIITTNLSLGELQNPADLEHGRTYDRIMERCAPVSFSGKNYRTDKGRANMENASGILRG